MTSSPSPQAPHIAEESEPFTCPICDRDISADRPPTLNLDNCSCGESGTPVNDPEDAVVNDPRNAGSSMPMSDVSTGNTASGGTKEYTKESNSFEQVHGPPEGALQDKPPSQNEPTTSLSFAMAAYLSAKSQQGRSNHEGLGLNHVLACPSANLELSDLDISIHLFPYHTLSSSACATKASSSMRSSLSSHKSWGSQTISCNSDTLICAGGWQEETEPVEMSWSSVLFESSVEV